MTTERSMNAPATGRHTGVAVYKDAGAYEAEHERVVHEELARRLARLLCVDFLGVLDEGEAVREPVYVVPTDTVVGLDKAHRLGIADESDLFGGVVPEPLIATKAITHPLVAPDAFAPAGWSDAFSKRVRDVVPAGFTAFTLEDARRAGQRLLAAGSVRVKSVRATAGRGQAKVSTAVELDQVLERLDPREVAAGGVVLEEQIDDVETLSVGQVRVGDLTASYYGRQRLTEDNEGVLVYGGSDLVVSRGGLAYVLATELPANAKRAIRQARAYDEAATECFPGFFASRRNYDIAIGHDSHGQPRDGVLEQSWRIGGASSAEVAALEALQANPELAAVRASSWERYEYDVKPAPEEADILFRGNDPDVGPITKWVTVEPYDRN